MDEAALTPIRQKTSWLWALICIFVSLALYAFTLCRMPFPGESIRSLLQHWGQHPFLPMDYPLWGMIQRGIAQMAGEDALLWAHAFAALLGALCVGLVYYLTASLTRGRSSEERVLAPEALQRINQCSGLAAALFFAVSTPVWVAGTRAYPLLWGVFILLLWLCALKVVWVDRSVRAAWVLAFLSGLGLAEYVVFFILFPLNILILAWVIYQSEPSKRLMRAAIFTFLFLLGCLPGLHTLLSLEQGAMAPYMGIDGAVSAFFFLARHRLFQLSTLMPQTGWLLVALQGAIPLFIILIPKRILERRFIWGSYVLHGVLTLICLLAFLNAPFSPWEMLKFKPFMILPALFTAVALGYLVGYWLGVCSGDRKFDHHAVQFLRGLGRYATLPLVAGFILLGGMKSYQVVDPTNGALVDAWVQGLCEDAASFPWVVSAGPTDELILYYRQRGAESAHGFMSDQLGNKRWLMAYYTDQFDLAILKSLGRLPLWPFVHAWLDILPEDSGQVFFATTPPANLSVVPRGSGYVATSAIDEYFLKRAESQSKQWKRLKRLSSEDARVNSPYAPMNEWVLRQASKSANNIGVYLEGQGQRDKAGAYYEQALSLNAENISALMNLGIWAERRGAQAKAAKIRNRLSDLLDNFEKKKNIWHLSEFYGDVRHPMAYLDRGMAWAMSGHIKQAKVEVAKVLAMDPDHARAKKIQSKLFILEGRGDEAEKGLIERINANPNDLSALRGLFQLRVLEQKFEEAETLLFRLRSLAGAQKPLALDEAALLHSRGDLAGAEKVLRAVSAEHPGDRKISLALAQLLIEQGREEEGLNLMVAALKTTDAMSPQEVLTTAKLLKKIGKSAHSRLLLDRRAGVIEHYQPALRFYLELQVETGDRLAVDRVLNTLLALDPNDPYGLFVLGLVHFGKKEWAPAEAAWARSVALKPAAGSLNSLAYVMHLRGRTLEALPWVQRALEMDANQAPAWDTLGVIYAAQHQYDQAVMALHKSIEINHEDPEVVIHLIEVYRAMGKSAEAQELIKGLRSDYGRLSVSTRERLDALR